MLSEQFHSQVLVIQHSMHVIAESVHASLAQCNMCTELEVALLESLTDGDAGPAPSAPPASKAIVKQLPIELLTHQRLQQLGGSEVQCSVCRCGSALAASARACASKLSSILRAQLDS